MMLFWIFLGKILASKIILGLRGMLFRHSQCFLLEEKANTSQVVVHRHVVSIPYEYGKIMIIAFTSFPF